MIERWTATDPYGQYWSPYIGMGNDPVQGIDPDGGKCKTCPDGQQYDTYRNSNLDYAFSKLASGDGVYQMLPEMEVTYRYEARPAMEMLAKFMTNYIMVMDGAFALEGIVSAGNYTAGMYSVARFEAVQAEKQAAKEGTQALVKAEIQFSKHSLERLAQRGVTKGMAQLAISKGQKFYDPLNRSINYVLHKGFASGKNLLVGTNPLTGEVTTVIRSSKNLINSRFIPIK